MWRYIAVSVLAILLTAAPVLATERDVPPAGSFSPAGALAEAGGLNAATLLADGRVFVIGGGFESPSAAEVWDPATSAFEPTMPLTWGRIRPTLTSLSDGRVLVVGGQADWVGSGYPRSWDLLRVAETWHPERHRFAPAGILHRSRGAHSALLLPDGRVLVVGGEFVGHYSTQAEVWDPSTEAFTTIDWTDVPRMASAVTLLADGRVLVTGGGVEDGLGEFPVAEIWDPASESFSQSGTLIAPRLGHTATLLQDGRVLIVGGYGEEQHFGSAEIWDPATGEFSLSGTLAQGRDRHTATLLQDGRVLVVGGFFCDAEACVERATAEIWDPGTGRFSPAGTLGEGRSFHTATLLPDGRVLIVGGEGEHGLLASAEVWTPHDPRLAAAWSSDQG